MASRPPTNDRRWIRRSRLYLRPRVELQPVRRETQLNRADTMATYLRRSEQPVLSSLRGQADARRRIRCPRRITYYVSASYAEAQILVFKLDSTGTLVWQHVYAIGTDSYAETLGLTSDGGFILGGLVSISTATSYSSSVLLLKLDSTGSPQFAKTYAPSGSISDLAITGVQQTSDGGYAFSGYYFQNPVYDERAWLVKTDSTGKVQWDRTYGADVQYSSRKFYSFQQTSDGGFIAAGSTNQFNGGDNSLWLVKTDSNGNIAGCNDVQTRSDVSGAVSVTVSISDLKATPDSFTYVADTLSSVPGPLKTSKEC